MTHSAATAAQSLATAATARGFPVRVASPAYRIDSAESRRACSLLIRPGDVHELRVLNARIEGRTGTYSGYFDGDHIDDLIAACERITAASAIYFTPNPVNPALLGRANNRARIVRDREPLTSDHDIVERRWLLIDVDAVRPAGISATDAERSAAMSTAVAIDYELWERGFPPGVICDSGNGAHVMIPIRMPTDDDGWHKRTLYELARDFDTPQAKVDISVHNPARIWKLPGTLTCKGEHCLEIGREWRMARIHSICQELPEDA